MSDIVLTAPARSDKVWVHAVVSMVVTLYLFYLDEGYYNFDWMNEPGNWVAFGIYFAGFMFGQALVSVLLLRKYKGKRKTLYSCLLGIPLGLALLLAFFYYVVGIE